MATTLYPYNKLLMAVIFLQARHLHMMAMSVAIMVTITRNTILSELLPNAQVNDKAMSQLLKTIGQRRDLTSQVMHHFTQGQHFLLLDATQVLSMSPTVEGTQEGFPLNP